MNAQSESSITEKAAEWLLVLREGRPQDRAAFAAWLKDSPRHVQEFLAVTALDQAFEGFDPQKRIAVTTDAASAVLSLTPRALGRARRPSLRSRLQSRRAVAAMLAGLAVVVLGWGLHSGVLQDGRRYATAVGEQRAFELPDGSVVHLNTHSEMRVRFSNGRRDIRLLAGEALFRVAPDKTRPFRVLADRTVIQALGTQFNVYRRAEGGATVAVLEGKVQVSTADSSRETYPAVLATQRAAVPARALNLSAGEEARVHSDGQVSRMANMDPVQVTAWRQRRLVFRKDALADIVAEFNRYNKSPQLRIADEALKELRLTGVFDADDPESLVQFLKADASLRFDKENGELVIRSSR